MVLLNQYEVKVRNEDIVRNNRRLINQLWKLIPMRENNEDWTKQLDTVILEFIGLNELFVGPVYLQILSKLEGLKVKETTFELYRKTTFECISLLQELNYGIGQ